MVGGVGVALAAVLVGEGGGGAVPVVAFGAAEVLWPPAVRVSVGGSGGSPFRVVAAVVAVTAASLATFAAAAASSADLLALAVASAAVSVVAWLSVYFGWS